MSFNHTPSEQTFFGFKKIPKPEKENLVRGVFDSVAPRYDLMNDLMSLGLQRIWKKAAISQCAIRPGQTILDLAGGTGDMTRRIHPLLQARGHLVLSDINASMLAVGRSKLLDAGIVKNLSYTQANAECLPFADHTFHTVLIAFGLRNVTDQSAALAEMQRVLRPGGRLVILEFSQIQDPLLAKLYDPYSFHILPLMGKIVCNDAESYRYLAESIRKHPNQENLKSLMESVGFSRCTYQNWHRGLVAIHLGFKI